MKRAEDRAAAMKKSIEERQAASAAAETRGNAARRLDAARMAVTKTARRWRGDRSMELDEALSDAVAELENAERYAHPAAVGSRNRKEVISMLKLFLLISLLLLARGAGDPWTDPNTNPPPRLVGGR